MSKKIADLAGVDYEAHYSVTSVDPPELMRYVMEYHPDVQWDYPRDKNGKRISMWTLIAEHTLPPTRMVRYCCSALKESHGEGRVTITGVRWAESANRKALHGVVDFQTKPKGTEKRAKQLGADFDYNKHGSVILNNDNDENRRLVEQCYRTRKTLVNPIVRWTDQDVWDFIHAYHLPYCSLYDEGFARLGCIGCPLSGRKNMERDFERWPRYRELYIRAFEKMIENHPGQIKILEPGYKAMYPVEPENLTGGGYRVWTSGTQSVQSLDRTWSDMNMNGSSTQTQPNDCCTIGQKSGPSENNGGVLRNAAEKWLRWYCGGWLRTDTM